MDGRLSRDSYFWRSVAIPFGGWVAVLMAVFIRPALADIGGPAGFLLLLGVISIAVAAAVTFAPLVGGWVAFGVAAFIQAFLEGGSAPAGLWVLPGLISIPVAIAITIDHAFAVVRRLHDLDRPAADFWLLFIPLFTAYLNLVLLFKRGTVGENQYGLDPMTDLRSETSMWTMRDVLQSGREASPRREGRTAE